jgi:hypothetical protein
LALAFNLIVTFCTESVGFVHCISLRSALASESRLRYNTSLRLLTLVRGWCYPNLTVSQLPSSFYLPARPHSLYVLTIQWHHPRTVTSPHFRRRTSPPGDDRVVRDASCQNIDMELLIFRLDCRTDPPIPHLFFSLWFQRSLRSPLLLSAILDATQ